MPGEEAELLPPCRIEDRSHSREGHFACDRHLRGQRPGRTLGRVPKRDEPALLSLPNFRGSSGKIATSLGDKDRRQSGSPVAAAPPLQFLFAAILVEWPRERRR